MVSLGQQIVANNADELFEKVIYHLQKSEDLNSTTVAKELLNTNLILTNPYNNTMCNCIRKMPMKYAIGELLWYMSKTNKVKAIAPYSKFWQKISDDGETVNSNYGYCIHKKYGFDQWEVAKQLLQRNSDSRQAVIHIKEARDLINDPTMDLNCTIALQFILREGKLHLITTMRSNDVWLGLPYDVFNFTCMQIMMAMELGVDVGTYCHNVGSLHLYKRDLNKLQED